MKRASEKMAKQPVIVWFQQDLRLNDNAALTAAVESGYPVIPLYLWSPQDESPWQPGGASRWWLHHSLSALDRALRRIGSRLVLRQGAAGLTLKKVVRESGATRVYMNRRYEPMWMRMSHEIETRLSHAGVQVHTFNSNLLFEPGQVLNASGKPFQVFTPFWKACLAQDEQVPTSEAPSRLPAPLDWPKTLKLDELQLLPKHDWAAGLAEAWTPGQQGAQATLDRFADRTWQHYDQCRDRPDIQGTSRLSPHLHWGEISSHQVWHAIRLRATRSRSPQAKHNAEAYLRQLVWREFASHLALSLPTHHRRTFARGICQIPVAL